MCLQTFLYFTCGHGRIFNIRCNLATDIARDNPFYILPTCANYRSETGQIAGQCGIGMWYCSHIPDGDFLDSVHRNKTSLMLQLHEAKQRGQAVQRAAINWQTNLMTTGFVGNMESAQVTSKRFHDMLFHLQEQTRQLTQQYANVNAEIQHYQDHFRRVAEYRAAGLTVPALMQPAHVPRRLPIELTLATQHFAVDEPQHEKHGLGAATQNGTGVHENSRDAATSGASRLHDHAFVQPHNWSTVGAGGGTTRHDGRVASEVTGMLLQRGHSMSPPKQKHGREGKGDGDKLSKGDSALRRSTRTRKKPVTYAESLSSAVASGNSSAPHSEAGFSPSDENEDDEIDEHETVETDNATENEIVDEFNTEEGSPAKKRNAFRRTGTKTNRSASARNRSQSKKRVSKHKALKPTNQSKLVKSVSQLRPVKRGGQYKPVAKPNAGPKSTEAIISEWKRLIGVPQDALPGRPAATTSIGPEPAPLTGGMNSSQPTAELHYPQSQASWGELKMAPLPTNGSFVATGYTMPALQAAPAVRLEPIVSQQQGRQQSIGHSLKYILNSSPVAQGLAPLALDGNASTNGGTDNGNIQRNQYASSPTSYLPTGVCRSIEPADNPISGFLPGMPQSMESTYDQCSDSTQGSDSSGYSMSISSSSDNGHGSLASLQDPIQDNTQQMADHGYVQNSFTAANNLRTGGSNILAHGGMGAMSQRDQPSSTSMLGAERVHSSLHGNPYTNAQPPAAAGWNIDPILYPTSSPSMTSSAAQQDPTTGRCGPYFGAPFSLDPETGVEPPAAEHIEAFGMVEPNLYQISNDDPGFHFPSDYQQGRAGGQSDALVHPTLPNMSGTPDIDWSVINDVFE